jgi:cyclopropane-fatty-acyl-phospholipid synthase
MRASTNIGPIQFDAAENPSIAGRILSALAGKITHGTLLLTLPNGQQRRFEGTAPGPSADLVVRNNRFLRRLIIGGSLGFAEAYIAGDCDTSDLGGFLALVLRNHEALGDDLKGNTFARTATRLFHLLHPNTKNGARRNIAHHYDLGNDFYGRWLDDGLTYSCALFGGGASTLEAAQEAKYRRIAEIADIRPEHHVLEIGCGWGGMAEYIAGAIGARVTAITISQAQYEYARRRIHDMGLADRVEVRIQDYREVADTFDRVVSIEMLEAVGERYWPTYFGAISRCLKPGGRAGLQGITIDCAAYSKYRRQTDFIQRYIFPGGMLPSVPALRQATGTAGLRWLHDETHGEDYARTLALWRDRFSTSWSNDPELGFDERFYRMWHYYLAYCEVGFTAGRIDLYMFGLAKA